MSRHRSIAALRSVLRLLQLADSHAHNPSRIPALEIYLVTARLLYLLFNFQNTTYQEVWRERLTGAMLASDGAYIIS